ncbi:hypothetical protein M5689_012991 [Euphorbia peplus]|nr:hypothetical protein M5689_012991 [Euphorbia peplus]
MFLVYGGGEYQVEGCTDASYEIDVDDFKSQYGFVFIVNGGALGKRLEKLYGLSGELGVVPDIVNPITLYCESTGAIA